MNRDMKVLNQELLKDISDADLEIFIDVLHKIKNNVRKEEDI